MLSKRILDALNADREYNGETLEDPPSTWYPNLVAVVEQIQRQENTSFHTLHDFWGLKRPFGLHAIGEHNADISNNIQEESTG